MWKRRQGRNTPITLEQSVEPGGAKLAFKTCAMCDSQTGIERGDVPDSDA